MAKEKQGSARNMIYIEGADCVGKTSIIECLRKLLREEPRIKDFHVLREPGGTVMGEDVRSILKTPKDDLVERSTRTELLLFNAARSHLLDYARSLPDTLFIFDRHHISTFVYQGCLGKELELVDKINNSLINKDEYLMGFLITAPEATRAKYRTSRGEEDCAIDQKYSVASDEMQGLYRAAVAHDPIDCVEIVNDTTVESAAAEIMSYISAELYSISN